MYFNSIINHGQNAKFEIIYDVFILIVDFRLWLVKILLLLIQQQYQVIFNTVSSLFYVFTGVYLSTGGRHA